MWNTLKERWKNLHLFWQIWFKVASFLLAILAVIVAAAIAGPYVGIPLLALLIITFFSALIYYS